MQPSVSSPLDLIPLVAREHAAAIKAERDKPQRRLMIVGTSGSGKTYSTATAPLPIYLDYDNQLNDIVVRQKLVAIFPMFDTEFTKTKLGLVGAPQERLIKLIETKFGEFTPQHTIILDSASQYGDLVKANLTEKFKSKDGDGSFQLWATWADVWRDLCKKIRDLGCNVIMTFHENELRNEETNRLEKYGWMMQGKEFTPRIPQYFTDVVRQIHEVEVDKQTGALKAERWLWQIKPTPEFPIAKSRCTTKAITIPATWSELVK